MRKHLANNSLGIMLRFMASLFLAMALLASFFFFPYAAVVLVPMFLGVAFFTVPLLLCTR